jgi:hypothetical protein
VTAGGCATGGGVDGGAATGAVGAGLAGDVAGGFFGPHDAAKNMPTASDPETNVAATHRVLERGNKTSHLIADTPSGGCERGQ